MFAKWMFLELLLIIALDFSKINPNVKEVGHYQDQIKLSFLGMTPWFQGGSTVAKFYTVLHREQVTWEEIAVRVSFPVSP